MTELAQAVLSVGWLGLFLVAATLGVCIAVIVVRAAAAHRESEPDESTQER